MGNTSPFDYISSVPFSVPAPCAADFGFAVASTPNLGSGILKTAASFALLLRLSVLGPS